MHSHDPSYPPLNTLKPVAEDIWIVDGPVIRFGMPWPIMPFPTRMTIIRIGRDLFIHSPTPLTDGLAKELADIGVPRWIIGPNRIHYWWIPDWHAAYGEASVYLAPRILQQSSGRIDFSSETLDRASGYPWDGALATLPVVGEYMTEVVFFHRPSRTLVLTDLIENFEPAKLSSLLVRWLAWLGAVQDPDGQTPRDMRLTYATNRAGVKAAVDQMIRWNPERVIIAHGRWYDRNGRAELERAFRWIR